MHLPSLFRAGIRRRPAARKLAKVAVHLATLILVSIGLAIPPFSEKTNAADADMTKPGQAAEISRGGRLYDNHWSSSSQRIPATSNPAYPAGEPPEGLTSWRCVSCHGWDYLGSAGHLGGDTAAFASIRSAAGSSPKKIIKFLKSSPGHQKVLAGLPDGELEYLAHFVCCGQHDINTVLDGDGKAKGDPLKGQDIYDNTCIRCHQADGKAPLYGEAGDVSSLGWIARERPEQAVHKIRNGVPNADMLSLRFLKIEEIGNLLAYLQTLD